MNRHVPANVARMPDPKRAMARLDLRHQTMAGPAGCADVVKWLSEPALRIRSLSAEMGGEANAVEMAGHSPAFLSALAKVEKIARYKEPVLITGESGVGKEQFAQALYLLGGAKGRPYVSVNCPQYQEGNLTVSELFGHKKGSFTGAIADRRGAFEEADGGVIFLDEIGDLPPPAQAMLLRTLATGEFRPLGGTGSRLAEVRVISATNRNVNELVLNSQFRYDLFFRLRHFHLDLPPLRDRADDWKLLVDYTLEKLARKYGVSKQLSPAAVSRLEGATWPGNVRQLIGVVSTGYGMASGELIEPDDFEPLIGSTDRQHDVVERSFERLVEGNEDFWRVVGDPFLERDLNRAQVRSVVRRGLEMASGNYRRVLDVFNLPSGDYQRFMDFLRHHNLKP
jgi:transcriptional regulator with GAF, ATPase, and Fis domain